MLSCRAIDWHTMVSLIAVKSCLPYDKITACGVDYKQHQVEEKAQIQSLFSGFDRLVQSFFLESPFNLFVRGQNWLVPERSHPGISEEIRGILKVGTFKVHEFSDNSGKYHV